MLKHDVPYLLLLALILFMYGVSGNSEVAVSYKGYSYSNVISSSCQTGMPVVTLLKQSYESHSLLIRQSVPMPVVKSFYEHALRQISSPKCICRHDGLVIDMTCIDSVFKEKGGLVTARLLDILAQESNLRIEDKLFPSFKEGSELPELGELERKAIADGLGSTLISIKAINETFWPGVNLPSDEVLRCDTERERACDEFAQKVDENGLWISATSLTAYVMGMIHQLFLLPERPPAGSQMLREHIQLVYLAARCKRLTGDSLRIPAVFLESVIMRTHIALKKSTFVPRGVSAALVTGFPQITAIRDIATCSNYFFGDAIRQMSSINSFGRAKMLSWNGTHVFATSLEEVMVANASRHHYIEYHRNSHSEKVTPVVCGAGFTKNQRLREVVDRKECCCANSCMRFTGAAVKMGIMNEMCCEACNEALCNVDDLSKVIEAQYYGFEHEREASVAKVW